LQSGQVGLPLYFIGAGPAEIRIAKFIREGRAVFGTDAPLPVAWRRALTSANQAEWPTTGQLGSLHGEAVRAHAGTSPCAVTGYSFQGKVVIEAARALQRAGGRLAMVLLIDSTAYTGAVHEMTEILRRDLQLIRRSDTIRASDNAENTVGFPSFLRRFTGSLLWSLAQLPPALKRRLAGLAAADDEVEEGNGWADEEGMPVTLADMTQLFIRLRSSFDPPPIDAAAVLFRTRRPGDKLLATGVLDNGWGGRFARGLEIIEASGDHWSLVRDERNVAALARQIDGVLDRIAVVDWSEAKR
jgi:thioesterase domain-containing protein